MTVDPLHPSAIETELRTQARHFAMIFNSARDMMLLGRVEAGSVFRVVSVNRQYLEAIRAAGFLLTAQDFEGRTFHEVMKSLNYSETALAQEQRRYEQVIAACRPLEFEEAARVPAGMFYGRTTIAPILNESGGCAFVLYSSQDITATRKAEKEKADSERTLRAILDHSFEFIGLMDPAGRLLRANQTSLRMAGVRSEDVLGHYFWDTPWWAHAPDEQVRLRDAVRRAAQGEFVRFETTHPATDGRLLHIDFSLQPVRDERGTVIALIPEGRDITERKQAEQALRESEEKFAKAFRACPDAMSVHELESGRYVDVNEGFLRLFRRTREEVVGHTPVELGVWGAATERQAFIERLRTGGSVRNHTVTVRLKDGSSRTCELSAEKIEIGGRAHNVTVMKDITERLAAERSLRDSEEKFAKAFRASPFSVTISELATGRYVDVNSGFEELSGYTRDEVIGRTSLELNLWVDSADRDNLVRQMREKGSVRGLEMSFRGKDGRIVSALCNCEPIEVAGVSCLLNVLEDTTERRRAEGRKAALDAQMQQNQKLEALGTLAGGIAHDFNNILTAIIINQELAVMDMGDPMELRRRLAEIGQASGRAKELVRQILTFSRQQTHERLRQHLQVIIREALGLLRASLPATIEISQDLSPEAPPVLADASRIHQVVMNLCTNAAHAMRDRPGVLGVRLAPRTLDDQACLSLPGLRPGRYAWLSVTDTGHGMDAVVQARIFEPFFTTKGPGEGTGLGLPMVHGIVRDYEGAIFVQSSPGQGTRFDLYFPEAVETGTPTPAAAMGIVPGRGESVLVVDDEESICEAIGAMLTRIGYRAKTFTDARLALEHCRENPTEFNLLLTDLTMPRVSGPELIVQIRELCPGLPALLMSGMNSAEAPEGDASGADYGLVAKPIDIADLSRAVRRALAPNPSPGHATSSS